MDTHVDIFFNLFFSFLCSCSSYSVQVYWSLSRMSTYEIVLLCTKKTLACRLNRCRTTCTTNIWNVVHHTPCIVYKVPCTISFVRPWWKVVIARRCRSFQWLSIYGWPTANHGMRSNELVKNQELPVNPKVVSASMSMLPTAREAVVNPTATTRTNEKTKTTKLEYDGMLGHEEVLEKTIPSLENGCRTWCTIIFFTWKC